MFVSLSNCWLVSIKFHMQHLGNRVSKVCSNGPGYMIKMALLIIYGTNLKKKKNSCRTTGLIALKLYIQHQLTEFYQVCSPGSVVQLDARSTGDQEGVSSRLRSGNILSLRLIMKSFLRSFSPFP